MTANDQKRILLLGDARQVHTVRWERFLRSTGFDVLTVSLEPVDAVEGPCERIRIPSFLPDFIRYAAAVPLLRRIIKRFEPDIVNAHFLQNYGAMATLSGFHPWVLSTWGSDVMLLPEKSPLHMDRTLRVIASADYITSDAEVMSQRLVDLGADRQKVITFPFGVERDLFHPPRDEKVRTETGPRILSNRKLENLYSIDTIISAFPAVMKIHPTATLTIAGSGSLESELHAAAARVAPRGPVRFVGHVAHDRMPDLLREHDIYVSMSLSDTTSVSLLEAMACGVFPVVSDIPANREWIDDGRNGLVVPTSDPRALTEAIDRAWRDSGFREKALERNQKLVAERADWTENMTIVVELLTRIHP